MLETRVKTFQSHRYNAATEPVPNKTSFRVYKESTASKIGNFYFKRIFILSVFAERNYCCCDFQSSLKSAFLVF